MERGPQFKYKVPHNLPEPPKLDENGRLNYEWEQFAMKQGKYADRMVLPDKPSDESLTRAEVRIHETDMPDEYAGRHTGVSTSGDAKRIHVIDPFDERTHRINENGHLEEHPEGTQGLVGYADVYRHDNGETSVGFINSVSPGAGRAAMEHLVDSSENVNLGYASDTMENLAEQINRKNNKRAVTYNGQSERVIL